jgi:basic membrane protein A
MARSAAVLAAAALALAACGEAPAEETDPSVSEGAAGGDGGGDFQTCMVSDAGGISDKSFNETAYKGLLDAQEAGLTGEPIFAESGGDADYVPNVESMVAEDCGLIVTVGFLLSTATSDAATANPEEKFAIVDSGPEEPIDNVKPLLFNTHEAAYLAGYLAAGVTETGVVGTWGGAKIPPVTIFMDGFADGIAAHNEAKGTDVQLIGWDKEAQDGSFVGDFENTTVAQQLSQTLISQQADIIMPVAGPLGESAASAAQAAGNVKVIWVDNDGFEALPEYQDIILTSVLKRIDVAVQQAVQDTVDDSYSNEPFVGTLENDGVGLAGLNAFSETVPAELQDEVDALREQIISGELVVESPAAIS